MNPETLAIARENLISRGIPNPHPDDAAKEALRIYEANKVHIPIKHLLIAFAACTPSVSPETVAEFLRRALNL